MSYDFKNSPRKCAIKILIDFDKSNKYSIAHIPENTIHIVLYFPDGDKAWYIVRKEFYNKYLKPFLGYV